MNRINIHDQCKCDTAIGLTDDQSSIDTRFSSAITKEDLLLVLENETYCHYPEEHENWRWAHPHEFCNDNMDNIKKGKDIGTVLHVKPQL